VECLWYADSPAGAPAQERALPTGAAHLAFRLSADPIRVFDGAETHDLGFAVLAGPRDRWHGRDTSAPARSIGVQLRPGVALLGPMIGLVGRHAPLDAVLPDLAALRDELAERSPERALARVEAALLARVAQAPVAPPAVRYAVRELSKPGARVAAVGAETGYSPRRFHALFVQWVGLAPKVFARLQRFRRAVDLAAAGRAAPWAELARSGGFADQAHLIREFRAFTGISPREYAPVAGQPHHVPILPIRSSRGASATLSGCHPGGSR
jgi:AraC-like DNA-binding protein